MRKLKMLFFAVGTASYVITVALNPQTAATPLRGISDDYEYVFVTTWGSEGSGDGQFYGPWGVTVGDDGYVSTDTPMPVNMLTIHLPLVIQGPREYLVGIEDLAQIDEIVAALQEIGVSIKKIFRHVRIITISLPEINELFGEWEIIARIEQIPGVLYVERDEYLLPPPG